ncbi:MAG TPA: cupin domain-containing protein [Pyrinomonadaceae bacterium]|jgi:mannose-6-phosphate isomerase-like protein (cupin superfamily)
MKIISLADLTEEGVSHNPEIRKKVLLRRGEVAHLTNLSQARLAPGQSVSPHTHADLYEIFNVLSGTGTTVIDGVEHRIETGSCIVVEPGEAHTITNEGSTDLLLLYFAVEDK